MHSHLWCYEKLQKLKDTRTHSLLQSFHAYTLANQMAMEFSTLSMALSAGTSSILRNVNSACVPGYTQMPMIPPTCAHLAPVGQPPKIQVKAQYLFPLWS